ncbi:MAG: glycosyltransferase, partial [Bacteroidales bacterium]|nr:glycosyltransferase [Bacteroidales bacterium]
MANLKPSMDNPKTFHPLHERPTVSVVVCTYNGGEYVRGQLDSILSQSYPIEEIIIQDDQSKDGTTIPILQEYVDQYPDKIRLFSTTSREGINHNFLTALKRAKSDLVAWSDQDDVWSPTKIERQVATLADNWICFHITHPFYGEVPDFASLTWDKRMPNFGLERTLFLGSVPGHTQLFRRDFFEWFCAHCPEEELQEIGKSYYIDTMLSIVANAYQKVVCIVEPLDLHRRLATSVSESGAKNISHRSLGNLVRQLVKYSNPKLRKVIRPVIQLRFRNMLSLLDKFPDAPYTTHARDIVAAYSSKGLVGRIRFLYALIRNRNRILFSVERHQSVAVL